MTDWQHYRYTTVDSTMNCAATMITHGLQANTKHIVVAQNQTNGRGRFNREWVSQSGNLLCSLILQPRMPLQYWPQLSFVTSLALYHVMKNQLPDIDIKLKWPNDVMVDGRKIAGILLEIQSNVDCSKSWLVVGVGVNIVSAPSNVTQTVTFMHEHQIHKSHLEHVLTIFLEHFDELLLLWQSQGFLIIRQQWLQQAMNLNMPVSIRRSGLDTIDGKFIDIDDQGRIIILATNNKKIIVSAGDVV